MNTIINKYFFKYYYLLYYIVDALCIRCNFK